MRLAIVVDTQTDFMDPEGALPVPGAAALVEPMRAWLRSLDPADVAGVLFTFDTHHAETYPASAEAELFPLHCVRGGPGWANVLDPGAVDPAISVHRLEKGVFDMWAEPGLRVEPVAGGDAVDRDLFFARLRERGVEEAVVIGVAADYCVRWAVAGLVARGFRVSVPAALTRGIERPFEAVVVDDFAGAPVRVERDA